MRSRLLPLGILGLGLLLTGSVTRAADPLIRLNDINLRGVHGVPELADLEFSPDGSLLYAGGRDDQVRVFDAQTLELVDMLGGLGARVDHIALSDDGATLAVGDRDGVVTLWDTGDRTVRYTFKGNGHPIVGLDWENGRIASAALHGPLRLLDASTGRPLAKVDGPGEWFGRVSFHMDSGMAGATGKDGKIRVFDINRGSILQTLDPASDQPTLQLAFSPDGAQLGAMDEGGTIRVWSIEDGTLLAKHRGGGRSGGIVFRPDGERVIARSQQDDPELWGRQDRPVPIRFAAPPRWTGLPYTERAWISAPVDEVPGRNDATISPDGALLAEGWGDTLRVWRVDTGQLVASRNTGLAAITAVAASSDYVAAATATGKVLMRDAHTGEQLGVFVLAEGPARRIDVNAKGQVAMAGNDIQVRVWDPFAGARAATLFGHEATVMDVAWDPRGRRLASIDDDGVVMLWDVASRQRTHRFETFEQGGWHIAFHPNGDKLVVWPMATDKAPSDKDALRVYQVPSGTELAVSKTVHLNGEGSVRPDGKRMVSLGEKLALVDPNSGETIARLPLPGKLYAVDWTRDGKMLGVGSQGGSLMLLNEAGQVQLSLRGHAEHVTAVDFSADGELMVSGSDDGTVRVWEKLSPR